MQAVRDDLWVQAEQGGGLNADLCSLYWNSGNGDLLQQVGLQLYIVWAAVLLAGYFIWGRRQHAAPEYRATALFYTYKVLLKNPISHLVGLFLSSRLNDVYLAAVLIVLKFACPWFFSAFPLWADTGILSLAFVVTVLAVFLPSLKKVVMPLLRARSTVFAFCPTVFVVPVLVCQLLVNIVNLFDVVHIYCSVPLVSLNSHSETTCEVEPGVVSYSPRVAFQPWVGVPLSVSENAEIAPSAEDSFVYPGFTESISGLLIVPYVYYVYRLRRG